MPPPDPVSELSSLEDDAPSPAAAETPSGIDRWNRVRELAHKLTSSSAGSRVRQKVTALNAIAQHVAAADGDPPESLFVELSEIYSRCSDELPERHKPLLVSPIQTLRFALRDRAVPDWFETQLKQLEAGISGVVPPVGPQSTGEECLDLEDYAIPLAPLAGAPAAAPPQGGGGAITREAKLAYLEACGCSADLPRLAAEAQTGLTVPFNDSAVSTFLREVAWMESVRSWAEWDAARAAALAQVANQLSSYAAAPAAPTILPAPGEASRKIRRLEAPPPVVLMPQVAAGGVLIVHPVAKQPPFRKPLLRAEDVRLLYRLRDACAESAAPAALPPLEGRPEPTHLASHFPVHATGSSKFLSASQDLMCSLCGLVLPAQSVKRTHLKAHLLRSGVVLQRLLGAGAPRAAPPRRRWLEVYGSGRPAFRARGAAELLGELLPQAVAPVDLGELLREGDDLALPTATTLACSSLRDASLCCVVCNGGLQPEHVDGQWFLRDVLVGQLQRSELCLRATPATAPARALDLESVVAGPADCAFRSALGRAYSSAAERKETTCPDELKAFFKRLLRAAGGDVRALQVLVQAFEREAQRAILQAEVGESAAASMLRASLHAFEYYLDRFVALRAAAGPYKTTADEPAAATAAPAALTVPLAHADAEFLYTRFGQGQLLLHAACLTPFIAPT